MAAIDQLSRRILCSNSACELEHQELAFEAPTIRQAESFANAELWQGRANDCLQL
jgi:hypothetical protein